MKIAISTDGNHVSAHFGRCPSFTIVEIKNNTVVNKEVIDNPGHHPGFLPQFFNERGIEYIIAGGMGRRATALFDQHNIQYILGVTGEVDAVIQSILDGTLEGGESLCSPGQGKDYGVPKTELEPGEEQ